jgi:menaquinone-9 beta-reductase
LTIPPDSGTAAPSPGSTARPGPVADVPVLVVGGGPSGAVTALLLARAGWPVELVDRSRFPRPKACGECLNPGGVALLDRLGLLERVVLTRPRPLAGWDLLQAGTGRWSRGRFRHPDRALGIERTTFDAGLLAAAREVGVKVTEGLRVTDVEPGNAGSPATVSLVGDDGGTWTRSARILVGADGLHSRVARGAGLARSPLPPGKASLTWRIRGWGPRPDRGRLILDPEVTVGLAPVDGEDPTLWNATLVVTDPSRWRPLPERGWPELRRRLLAIEAGWDAPPVRKSGPWASGSFRRPVRAAATGRIALVGDAAGYFDPLTGQGIHAALRSARLLAELVAWQVPRAGEARIDPGDPEILRIHDRNLQRDRKPGRTLQRTVEAVLSRRWSAGLALTTLHHVPGVASSLVRLAGDRGGTALPGGHPTAGNPMESLEPDEGAPRCVTPFHPEERNRAHR